MTTPTMIGFGHRARVGKDTAARMLRDFSGGPRRVGKHSFAFSLKFDAWDAFNRYGLMHPEHYDVFPDEREVVLPAIGKTPRQLWIEYGNFMRSIDPDYWVSATMANKHDNKRYIFADVRFPNEAAAIKARGGILVRIDRPSEPHRVDGADDVLADYDGWDYLIVNDGSLDDLRAKVKQLATEIGWTK